MTVTEIRESMETMTTPWKKLLVEAMESNSHLKHSKFFQLATISLDGRPSNRTMVFRGFQNDDSNKILINIDSRTRKVEDLKRRPFTEVCWYFADSWEQFRINGTVDVVDGMNPDAAKLALRDGSWFASSLRSRAQYLGPNPGYPSSDELQLSDEILIDGSSGPVDAFCVLVLDPNEVDYLNLKTDKRIRFSASDFGDKLWV